MSGELFKPIYVRWNLPFFCNFKCGYCFRKNRNLKELAAYNKNENNVKLYIELAMMLKSIDIPWVSFGGGEPTLFADNLKDLFLVLHEQDMGYGMTTNWSLDPSRIKNMLRYIDSINLSFDNISLDYKLSKKNDCRNLLSFIKKCKDINPNIIFNATTVLLKENISNIIDILDWLKETGEIRFVFIQPCDVPRYYPSKLQVDCLKRKIQSDNLVDAKFSNLDDKLLEYFYGSRAYLHHRDCSMFFSKLNITTIIDNKKYDIDFLLSPCLFDFFPNAISSSYTISSASTGYDKKRSLKIYLRKLYSFIKKALLRSGGFYSVCSFGCPCGPEAFLDDVFWGRREFTTLTSNPFLLKKITEKLTHNRSMYEQIVEKSLKTTIVDRDSFSNVIVHKDMLLWIDLRRKKIVMKTKISKKIRDCLTSIQIERKRYFYGEFKKQFDLTENEENLIKFLLFHNVINNDQQKGGVKP